jgi:glucose/arabinose dehydrogenase
MADEGAGGILTARREIPHMPVTDGSIRSAIKVCCIVFVPLLAACGDDSGDADNPAAASCSSTQTVFTPPAPPPGAPPAGITLSLEQIDVPLAAPVFVTAPRGDTARIFVVEKGGMIKVVNRNNNTLIGTFLNISSLVATEGEAGLHSVAFDPQYGTNGRFYVSYTNTAGNTVVARYLVSGNPNVAQAGADRILMTAAANGQHFGGMLAFDPAGRYLYISRGDGGPAPDQFNRAQNLGQLQGKILRIDVSGGEAGQPAYTIPPDNPCLGQVGARGEIWSMGLRNPWRFSFDRATGDLYIADVGENFVEEVNVATVANGAGRGSNFGWKIMEGKRCFPSGGVCNQNELTQPTLDYTHPTEDCGGSITGGYVYRGSAIPALAGTYFYGDFCEGFVRSFRFNGQVQEHAQWPSLATGGITITSFGEDGLGELYITTIGGGLFRIVP